MTRTPKRAAVDPAPTGPARKPYAEQCTRVYTHKGRVAHLLSPASTIMGGVTLCPAAPSWPDEWRGTGSQAEHELAASLPLCKACEKRATAEDEYYSEPSQWRDPENPAAEETPVTRRGARGTPAGSAGKAAPVPPPMAGAAPETPGPAHSPPVPGQAPPSPVRRSYKFLLRPTAHQRAALEACLEDTRQLYNAALEERREAWRMGKHRITFYSQDAQLKDIRAADPERYGRWAQSCERAAIRRLDRAFQAFYKRYRTGQKPGYPRFKGCGWFDSIEWEHKNGAIWDSVPHPTVTRVRLQGVGHVRVHQHRAVKGRVKTVTVKRENDRWYVILACDDVPAEPLPATGAVVGIDMGLAHFLTMSDGTHVPNPRLLAATAERLADAHRSLSRKKRGSNRRRKAVRKVAGLHAKVRRQRRDHAHKTALALVRDHDVIAHEALNVANLTRRPKPRPGEDGSYEPNGAAAKAGLNKSINDAGWGVFLEILHAKAESAGREVIEVDPRHTSQRCSRVSCGHVAAGNRVTQAEFKCVKCGHEAHADVNAATNILRAGLVLREAA